MGRLHLERRQFAEAAAELDLAQALDLDRRVLAALTEYEEHRLRENLRAIIDATRAAHPEVRVVLAGMRAAPNLGRRYVEAFEATFPALAAETGASLIPLCRAR